MFKSSVLKKVKSDHLGLLASLKLTKWMKLQCSSSYPEFFCWTLNPFKKMFVFFGVQFSTSDIISINTLTPSDYICPGLVFLAIDMNPQLFWHAWSISLLWMPKMKLMTLSFHFWGLFKYWISVLCQKFKPFRHKIISWMLLVRMAPRICLQAHFFLSLAQFLSDQEI